METKIFIADLAEGLARRKSISKKDAENFVRTIFDTIQEQLLAGESVKIKGLGTFKVITVESRESVNVSTGERFVIDSHGKISFTPDKALADHVNKPFAGFETVILNDNTKTEDMERIEEEPAAEEPAPEVKPEVPEVKPEVPELKPEAPVKPEPKVDVKPEPKVEVAAEVKPVEEKPAKPVEEKPVKPVEVKPAKVEEKPAKVEVKTVKVVEKPKAEAPKPKAAEPVKPAVSVKPAAEPEKPKSKWWIWCLVLVLIIAGAVWYTNNKSADSQAVEQVAEPQDSVEVAPAPVKSAEELAADYDQIAGGEYWIVGTKTTHVLEKGEDLSQLALKYYDNKRLINYIIKHNHYSAQKASNMYVGDEVKIPELVKRD